MGKQRGVGNADKERAWWGRRGGEQPVPRGRPRRGWGRARVVTPCGRIRRVKRRSEDALLLLLRLHALLLLLPSQRFDAAG
jgi:hypothetical protein